MRPLIRQTLLLIFFTSITFHVNAQALPSRINIPSWVKMGMALSEVNKNIHPDTLSQPGGKDDGNYYSYRLSNNDWHRFQIDPREGLVSLQISTNYFDVNSIVKNIIEAYEYPYSVEENNITWVFEDPVSDVIAIKLYIFEKFFMIEYFFDNYMN